ncbi:hypothetical protein RJT34_23462 [Clitoria ternatea]|uniref:Uncharacterized protein n=1 Tax=Clitoria ternatea TaxID=43366 RepID=A0AAN9FMN0_CLITE
MEANLPGFLHGRSTNWIKSNVISVLIVLHIYKGVLMEFTFQVYKLDQIKCDKCVDCASYIQRSTYGVYFSGV